MTMLRIAFVCDAAAPIADTHRALLNERLSGYVMDIHMVRAESAARTSILTRIAHVAKCEGRYVSRSPNHIRLSAATSWSRWSGGSSSSGGCEVEDWTAEQDASSATWACLAATGAPLILATVVLEPLLLLFPLVPAPASGSRPPPPLASAASCGNSSSSSKAADAGDACMMRMTMPMMMMATQPPCGDNSLMDSDDDYYHFALADMPSCAPLNDLSADGDSMG
jgi:hypothetical protein